MITVVMEPGMKDKSRWTASLGGKLAGKMWIDASGDDPAEVYAKEIRQRLLKSMSEERRKEAEMHEKARHETVRQAGQAEDLRRSEQAIPLASLAGQRRSRRSSTESLTFRAVADVVRLASSRGSLWSSTRTEEPDDGSPRAGSYKVPTVQTR